MGVRFGRGDVEVGGAAMAHAVLGRHALPASQNIRQFYSCKYLFTSVIKKYL